MKKGKFTLVQQYVIDSLMNNNHTESKSVLYNNNTIDSSKTI